jgi:hypothetical protein
VKKNISLAWRQSIPDPPLFLKDKPERRGVWQGEYRDRGCSIPIFHKIKLNNIKFLLSLIDINNIILSINKNKGS